MNSIHSHQDTPDHTRAKIFHFGLFEIVNHFVQSFISYNCPRFMEQIIPASELTINVIPFEFFHRSEGPQHFLLAIGKDKKRTTTVTAEINSFFHFAFSSTTSKRLKKGCFWIILIKMFVLIDYVMTFTSTHAVLSTPSDGKKTVPLEVDEMVPERAHTGTETKQNNYIAKTRLKFNERKVHCPYKERQPGFCS